MKYEPINWDEIPKRSTARYLLQSGKIPCEYTGKQTRYYKIHKQDVIEYLENRKVFPESFSAPKGWYSGHYTVKMQEQVPAVVLDALHDYDTELLAGYPGVLKASGAAKLTGYGRTAVNNWCHKGHLMSLRYLAEFFAHHIFAPSSGNQGGMSKASEFLPTGSSEERYK